MKIHFGYMKQTFLWGAVILLAACKISDNQLLLASDDIVPLPDRAVILGVKANSDPIEVETFTVIERLGNNHFDLQGDNGSAFFSKVENSDGFWILELPNKDEFWHVLTKIEDDKVSFYEINSEAQSTLRLEYPEINITSRSYTLMDLQKMYSTLITLNSFDNESFVSLYVLDATDPDFDQGDIDQKITEIKNDVIAAETLQQQQQAAEQRETEQAEKERQAQAERERQRLIAEQNAAVQDRASKVVSFSDRTELSFCISDTTVTSSIKAASEQSYFTFINRLTSLRDERLCTARLSMENIEELTLAVELWEEDAETGRIFMVGSIARNYFNNCPPCDNLRPSDRLYFVAYNEVGGDQYGWKGYEQFIFENRTVGGIVDFFLTE